jgi:hypothetical protein
MESLEQAARIVLTARLLGRVNVLSPAQVAELVSARRRVGMAGANPEYSAPESRRREQ